MTEARSRRGGVRASGPSRYSAVPIGTEERPPSADPEYLRHAQFERDFRLRRAERRARERAHRRRVRAGGFGALALALCGAAGVVGLSAGASRTRADPSRAPFRSRLRHRSHLSVGGEPAAALPFAPNPQDRRAKRGEVPSLYADGLPCSTGCRPAGALPGWPIKPFHREHGIRAGLNELRPGSMHVAVDIQARDGAAVYALQPGDAQILAGVGPNSRVQVGNYIYWHITPSVTDGEAVVPFLTVLGHVQFDYGHLALSEFDSTGYANPLRPGGIVLSPYVDHAPPEIARPDVAAGGQVVVAAYSPQTFVQRTTYPTPVLAPAGLAWRLFTLGGAPLTPLEWSFRGTHLLPFDERELIYAPGAHAPGFHCFAVRPVCVPHWVYRVAGGLTPVLPRSVRTGPYRLTIYAWDWADNVTALDTRVTMTERGWSPIGSFPRSLFSAPGYYTVGAPDAAGADSGPENWPVR